MPLGRWRCGSLADERGHRLGGVIGPGAEGEVHQEGAEEVQVAAVDVAAVEDVGVEEVEGARAEEANDGPRVAAEGVIALADGATEEGVFEHEALVVVSGAQGAAVLADD